MTEGNGLFLILLNGHDHRVVVVDRIVDTLSSLFRHRDGREGLFNLLLHLVDIEVAHNNDGLQVRTIPFLIVVAQVLIGKIVDDIH